MSQFASDRGPDYEKPPAYPVTIMIAGIGWIVFGGGMLLVAGLVLLVALLAAASSRSGNQGGILAGAGLCIAVVIGLFGAAFLFVGIQSVRGTSHDTRGNGVGSIVFGFLCFALVGLQMVSVGMNRVGGAEIIGMGFYGLVGIGLIVTGILALVGMSDYRAWRAWHKAHKDIGPRY